MLVRPPLNFLLMGDLLNEIEREIVRFKPNSIGIISQTVQIGYEYYVRVIYRPRNKMMELYSSGLGLGWDRMVPTEDELVRIRRMLQSQPLTKPSDEPEKEEWEYLPFIPETVRKVQVSTDPTDIVGRFFETETNGLRRIYFAGSDGKPTLLSAYKKDDRESIRVMGFDMVGISNGASLVYTNIETNAKDKKTDKDS